ncbi:MAG: hypothetical protein ACREJ2_01835, partial [Planctomycetota bacterium]
MPPNPDSPPPPQPPNSSRPSRSSLPPAGNPASQPPGAEPATGLTRIAKAAEPEIVIDATQRARVDRLWKDALAEDTAPSVTLGAHITVDLAPDSPTLPWQERLPQATIAGGDSSRAHGIRVIVEDATGRVQVHHDDENSADEGARAIGDVGGLDAGGESLAGGTLDAPPSAAPRPGSAATPAQASDAESKAPGFT